MRPNDRAGFAICSARMTSDETGAGSSDRSIDACAICGSDSVPHHSLPEYEILRCTGCGLGTVRPMPTPDELSDFYASAYYSQSNAIGYHSEYTDLEPGLKRMYGRFLDRIERTFGPTHFDRVLDVGCAYGYFLDVVEERFAPTETVGIDVSPEARAQAERRGRRFHDGFIEDVELPDGHFDLVFMGDAIEHVHDPIAVADKLTRVLAPGGVLLLTTIDYGSWLARLLGARWRLLVPPEHLFFWTRPSLAKLFADRGLETQIGNYWLYYPKSYVLQRTRAQFGFTPRFLGLVPGDLIAIPSFDAMMGVFQKPLAAAGSRESGEPETDTSAHVDRHDGVSSR